MDLRVLPLLCVLACLAAPIFAYTLPDEPVRSFGFVGYIVPATYPEAGAVSIMEAEESAVTIRLEDIGAEVPEDEASGDVLQTIFPAYYTLSGKIQSVNFLQTFPSVEVVVLEKPANFFIVRKVEEPTGLTKTYSGRSGEDHGKHTLAPDEKRYFSTPVREGVTHHWIDIRWDASAGDLMLYVYPPDGCLGPYTDSDDGESDGRIFLDVSSSEGLTPGAWYYEIACARGNGTIEFSFETYT